MNTTTLMLSLPAEQAVRLFKQLLKNFNFNQFILVCSSTSSCSTKFDPELLRADLTLAKERVYRLRKELARIQTEMTYTQKGVDTLYG